VDCCSGTSVLFDRRIQAKTKEKDAEKEACLLMGILRKISPIDMHEIIECDGRKHWKNSRETKS
jgi:hypothetical protein